MKLDDLAREELEHELVKRLKATIAYAKENSPYYKKQFEELGVDEDDFESLEEDLVKLPLTFSGELQRKNREFISSGSYREPNFTSGTTGKPKITYATGDDWEISGKWGAEIYKMIGVTPEDRLYNMSVFGFPISGKSTTKAAEHLGVKELVRSGLKLPSTLIKRFNPSILIGFPTKLNKLPSILKKKGIDPKEDLNIEKVILGGEGTTVEKKKKIKDKWGAESIGDYYGVTEARGPLGGTCEELDGMHIMEPNTYVEIVDPETGEQLGENEKGKVAITTLVPPGRESGTVLFRYVIGDEAEILSKGGCECGSPLTKISWPWRPEKHYINVSGAKLSKIQLESILSSTEGFTGEFKTIVSGDAPPYRVDIRTEFEGIYDESKAVKSVLDSLYRANPPLFNEMKRGNIEVDLSLEEEIKYEGKGKPRKMIDKRRAK